LVSADKATLAIVRAKVKRQTPYKVRSAISGMFRIPHFKSLRIKWRVVQEPGEQEVILMEKAEQLGLSFNTTLMELLERDQMDDFESRRKMILKMYIDSDEIPHIIQFYNGEETYRLD
jgi:hypothetical protein